MNFAEIIYQSALFTATFFVFNRLFSRYFFKNREEMSISFSKVATMFVLYVVFGSAIHFVTEKYSTPKTPQNSQESIPVSGQALSAATTSVCSTPLNLTTNFLSEVVDQELTTITTDLAEYVFSTRGATLQAMMLLWKNNQRVVMLGKSDQYFAIALHDKTPVAYKLVKSELVQDGNAHELIYQSTHGREIIEKKFIVYKHSYQFDVIVSCKNAESGEQVRLIAPAPVMTDELQAVVNIGVVQNSLKLQDIALNKSENFNKFWFEPTLFGFTSRFFTNVCFASSMQANGRAYLKEFEDKTCAAIFESKAFDQQADFSWSFYFGPKSVPDLKKVSPALSGLVNYGVLSFLATPLASALIFVQEKTGNYGWAIILVALLLKLLMVPFTLRSERGMREQAEFEKKRQHLQQKFKHDKAALDKATAELIQKHGLPIFSGCLPLLLNIPVFIALNKVLTTSTELYGASFLWLPDLSAADPFYILSIVTFVGMIFVPTMQPSVGPRQLFSKIGFALFLAAVTSYLASGLALFVVVNTLFGIVQTFVIKKVRWLSARFA